MVAPVGGAFIRSTGFAVFSYERAGRSAAVGRALERG